MLLLSLLHNEKKNCRTFIVLEQNYSSPKEVDRYE